MSRNVQSKSPVLKVLLPRRLGHMQVDSTMRRRPLNIKVHVQMFHTSLVRLQPARNSPVPRPPAVRRLTVRRDFPLRVHSLASQDLNTFGVFAHAVCGAVEDCGLAVCAEDFDVEDCEDGAGGCEADEHEAEVEGLLGCAGGFFADGEVLPGDAAGVVHDGDGLPFAYGGAVWRGGLGCCETCIDRSCGGDCWTESRAEDEERRGQPQW